MENYNGILSKCGRGYGKEEIKEEEADNLIIGGDFNARMENKKGPVREEDGKRITTRKLADKTISKEKEKILVKKIEERGWMILNGSFNILRRMDIWDKTGTLVIDYAIANEKAEENIERVKEGDRMKSDHVPLEVEVQGQEAIEERKKVTIIKKNVWAQEEIENYRMRYEGWTCEQTEKMRRYERKSKRRWRRQQ